MPLLSSVWGKGHPQRSPTPALMPRMAPHGGDLLPCPPGQSAEALVGCRGEI